MVLLFKGIYRTSKKYLRKNFPGVYDILDKYKVGIKYIIAGCIAVAVDLGLLYVFTDIAGLWYLTSAAIAFVFSLLTSFSLHKFWTFRESSLARMKKQFILFLILALANLIINTVLIYIAVDIFKIWYLYAQFIIAGVIALMNFVVNKTITFRRENKTGKNILIATGIYPPDIGGPATMLAALARDLTSAGFSIKIITYADKTTAEKSEPEIYKISRGRGVFSYLKYFEKICRLSRWADIIYVTDTYSVGYFAYLIKKLTGKKYIVRFAGDSAWETAVASGRTRDYIVDFQKNKYGAKIEKLKNKRKKILVNADKVIAVSDFMNKIARAIGVSENKIKTIYNSVDFIKSDSFDGKAIASIKKQYGNNAKIIVTACRLTPWKGVDGIIKIIPKLTAGLGGVNFLILGDGQELNNLKKLADEFKVSGQVYFLGKIKQAEMINYFKAADLFILNTNYEGLSHAILEVMAAGTPVLTTNAGGNPEIIDNNKDGVLVEFNNERELSEAAVKILNNKEFSDGLAANAKIKLHKFNWSGELAETIKLLKEVYGK